jgi:hypothetical protein
LGPTEADRLSAHEVLQSTRDVRFGSKADLVGTNANVRFVPQADIPNSRIGGTDLGAEFAWFLFAKQQNAVAPKRSLDRDMASEKTARGPACRHPKNENALR